MSCKLHPYSLRRICTLYRRCSSGGGRVLCKEYKCNLQVTPGWLAVQLPWLVNLALLMCNVDHWVSGRILALHSVVIGSVFSGGDHGIHCWWDLIISYLPTPLLGQDMTQGQFFKQSLAGLNSEFSFPRLVASARLKNLVCPTIYP